MSRFHRFPKEKSEEYHVASSTFMRLYKIALLVMPLKLKFWFYQQIIPGEHDFLCCLNKSFEKKQNMANNAI